MHRSPLRPLFAPGLALALSLGASGAFASPTIFGTLDNFDVFNNTGHETHGFEIELEDLAPSDVVYFFAAPYIRYDAPVVVPTATGVIVRYQSAWTGSGFVATTPTAPSGASAGGHDCYSGGPIGNYATAGCEHFGLSTNKTPTKTTYRWLVEDTTKPGTGALIADGGTVSLPAPVVTVTPPADPAAPPVVEAVVQAPPPREAPPGGEPQWGDAIWVKVFKIETSDDVALEDLLRGAPVINAAEAEPPEIEWKLLQSPPVGETAESEDLLGGGELGERDGAVVRRYEFYAYTGPYDPENHEALLDNPDDPRCGVISCIGAIIGAQMIGVNFEGAAPVLAVAPGDPGTSDVPAPASALLLATGLALLRQRR